MRKNSTEAQRWADKIWKEAANRWISRKQDLNYRKYVSRPAMERVVEGIPIFKNGTFLDVGCGNGSETFHLASFLSKNGHSGKMIGVDQNELFIKSANKRRKSKGGVRTFFQKLNVSELAKRNIGQADIIMSVFLLQDLPDTGIFFKAAYAVLRQNGYGIFLLLHPNFAKIKKAKGALKVERKLRTEYWRWAAKYQIVEEDGKTFYVPYFHRTMCDYLKLARKYFNVVSLVDVLPSKTVIAESERQKLSPLYSHPGNVYYPEIVKIPSSLIIKIQK